MIFGKRMRKSATLVFALLFVIGLSVSASVATQGEAQAITTCATPSPGSYHFGAESINEPTYNFIPHVTCTALEAPAAKACETMDLVTECVDLYVNTDHTHDLDQVYAVDTFFCKNQSGQYLDCDDMLVTTEMGYKFFGNGSASTQTSKPYECSGGSCPVNGPASISSPHATFNGSPTLTNQCWEVWAIAPSTESVGNVSFLHTLTSPHVNICTVDSYSNS